MKKQERGGVCVLSFELAFKSRSPTCQQIGVGVWPRRRKTGKKNATLWANEISNTFRKLINMIWSSLALFSLLWVTHGQFNKSGIFWKVLPKCWAVSFRKAFINTMRTPQKNCDILWACLFCSGVILKKKKKSILKIHNGQLLFI